MKNIEPVFPKPETVIHSEQERKPFVSVVVPAYNEASILTKNLTIIGDYMKSLEDEYSWEMIIVNDGSTDETGELAEAFARTRSNVRVLHHIVNFRLGQALRFAFNQYRGDYVVTMDVDLSYSPDHIERLLTKIRETKAKVVIASPYMKGGKVSNVPWLRKTFSIWANRFLSLTAKGNISTFTSMVRAYDGKFLSRLNLKDMDVGISPEIIYKAMILGARIEEIPAHLDWSLEKTGGKLRKSSIRIMGSVISSLMSGFIFRPFMFFILPSLVLFLLSAYTLMWVFIHTFDHYRKLSPWAGFAGDRFTEAIAAAYNQAPHAFFVGGITLLLGIQLFSLGVLALQSKRYFEEIFYLGTSIYKYHKDNEYNL